MNQKCTASRSSSRRWRTVVIFAACLTAALPAITLAEGPSHRIPDDPAFALPGPNTAMGTSVNSTTLVENARAWNGQIISFAGEVVGELMERGQGSWIHLNDDAYMWKNIEEGATLGGYNSGHAVWIAVADGRRIRYFGDYKHEGDILRVTGVFNAACRDHGGDMDIHAALVEVVRVGHPVGHVVNRRRAALAAGLFGLTALLWLIRRKARLRRI